MDGTNRKSTVRLNLLGHYGLDPQSLHSEKILNQVQYDEVHVQNPRIPNDSSNLSSGFFTFS